MPIARRNLLEDKVKFLFALGGVTLAIVLILVIQSVFQGVNRDSKSFIRSLPGDVWVTQRGVSGLTLSNSFLTDRNAAEVAAVPGVTAVHRLSGRLTAFEADGDETGVYAWALAPGGALSTEDSRFLPEPGTIFVDRALAKKAGVSRGDVLRYDGSEFTVAEVERIGNLIIAQFAFIHHEDYSRLFGGTGAANFFLVSLSADATDGTMEEIARRVEGTSVLTTDEFVEVAEQANRDFLIIVRVVMVISFIVGLALLSLTIYSATIERVRDYGIMKALGASPWQLYRIVLSQSATIAVLGFGAGVGLAFLFNRVAGDVVPEFVTYIRLQDIAVALGIAGVMTFVASFLPIHRVAEVDPASVFRA